MYLRYSGKIGHYFKLLAAAAGVMLAMTAFAGCCDKRSAPDSLILNNAETLCTLRRCQNVNTGETEYLLICKNRYAYMLRNVYTSAPEILQTEKYILRSAYKNAGGAEKIKRSAAVKRCRYDTDLTAFYDNSQDELYIFEKK
ncbi:hypothetical protein [Ruminococcus sp. Marseille-P6503]|uniref:hypothetical protein n=1 Tax=Ruminococcus sp. Marseille-P6503 TaxID=2364796 RepID=UPI000F5332B4|nr:hypothetical protein [Ruminococcus sp. Marseille-P6503]